jgi:membrane-bound serine protease (ClpP class)
MVSSELMTWLAVLAFMVGFFALLAEIVFVPGFGVAGVAGVILIGWGVLLLSVDFTQATGALVLAMIATMVLFVAGIKIFSKLKLWQRMTLIDSQKKESGYLTQSFETAVSPGMTGTALTPLRPAGSMDLNGKRLDVVTSGEYIAPGTRVEIIKLEGARTVVRAVSE